jgi:hypothetical protein
MVQKDETFVVIKGKDRIEAESVKKIFELIKHFNKRK